MRPWSRRARAGARTTGGGSRKRWGAPFRVWATVQPSCTAVPVARSTVGCGWDLCVRAVWGRAGRGSIGHSHVMLGVMMGMHQWGLRRLPPRDARERSREPRGGGGRGVVLGMSSQRESAGASQRYLLAEPNWLECARNSVCVRSARRPRGHMISRNPVYRRLTWKCGGAGGFSDGHG